MLWFKLILAIISLVFLPLFFAFLYNFLLNWNFYLPCPGQLRNSLTHINWIAWLTFYLIVAALFREKLLELIFKAKLRITASSSSEFAHEVDDRYKNGRLKEKQYWFGIRIENIGSGSAKNVEVYFKGLESNIINNFAMYNAIPLRRSWVHHTSIKHFPPNLSIRWDVCCLHKKEPERISFKFLKTPNALIRMRCKPGKKSNFKFEIIAKADNAKTRTLPLEIVFKGKYKEGFEVNSC